MQDLTKATSKVDGIRFYPQLQQDVRIGGRQSKSPNQYTLSSVDIGELNAFWPKLVAKLEKLPQLQGVTTDQSLGSLEYRVNINRDAAAQLGVSALDIDSALYSAFGQRQVSVIYNELDQNRVVLEADEALLKDPS